MPADLSALQDALVPHIRPIGRRRHFGIDEWSAFSNGDRLRQITGAISALARQQSRKPNLVAALGRSGLPLAVAMSVSDETLRDWIYVSDPSVGAHTRKDLAIKPEVLDNAGRNLNVAGRTVLLVDSVTKSGKTALDAAQKVRLQGGTVTGFIVLLDYPKFDDRSYLAQLKAEFGVTVDPLFRFTKPEGDETPSRAWLSPA